MDDTELKVAGARRDEQIETLNREMKEIKAEIKSLKDIAFNVQRLAISIETLTEDMKEMKADVSEIKKEPASAWKNFKWAVVGILTTCVVGGLAAALFSIVVMRG